MDQLQNMSLFVQVAEHGGLRQAARSLGLSPATVSTRLSELERRLGVLLMQRSTRAMTLTDEGREYLAHCVRLLADIGEVEQQLRQGQQEPRGRLFIGAPATLANHLLIPALPGFFARHPGITVELDQSQNAFELSSGAGHRVSDVLLRMGPFEDSSLIARPLGSARVVTVASPGYVEQSGMPAHPKELAQHRCIAIAIPDSGRIAPWQFEHRGRKLSYDVQGPLITNGGDGRVQAALAGLGITQAPAFQVAQALADGRLLRLLADWESAAPPVFVLYSKAQQRVPRVDAFVSYLLERYPAGRAIALADT